MANKKKQGQEPENPLDGFWQKRPRGRPGVRASEVAGRSYHYHLVFNQIWDLVEGKLLQAKTSEDIIGAFGFSEYYLSQFKDIAALILRVVHDRHFPKSRNARINFVADSLAALGERSPRRSRDICGRWRAKEKRLKRHHIIRREFYIECSCGYKGPARDNGCRKCGAQVPLSLTGAWLGI